jgi:hypothetical protein
VDCPPPHTGCRPRPWCGGGGLGLSGDDGAAAEPRSAARYPPTMQRARALLQCGRMGRAWALHNTLHSAPKERWTRLTRVFEPPERLPTSPNEIGQGIVIPPQHNCRRCCRCWRVRQNPPPPLMHPCSDPAHKKTKRNTAKHPTHAARILSTYPTANNHTPLPRSHGLSSVSHCQETRPFL